VLSQHGHIKRIHFEPEHPVDDDPSSPSTAAIDDEAPNTAVAQLIMRKKFLFPTRYQSDGQSDTESHKSGFTNKSMEAEGSFLHPCRNPNGDPQDFGHLLTAFVVFESQSQATKCVKARVRSMDGMRCIHKYDYNKVAKKFRTAQMKGEKLSFSPPPPNFNMLQHQHSGGRDHSSHGGRGMSPSGGHRNYNDGPYGNSNRSYRDKYNRPYSQNGPDRGRYDNHGGPGTPRGYQSYRDRSGPNQQDHQFRRNYQQRYNNRDRFNNRDRYNDRDRNDRDRNDRNDRNERYYGNNNHPHHQNHPNHHSNHHHNSNNHSGPNHSGSNPNQSPYYMSSRRKNSDDMEDDRDRHHQHRLGGRQDRQSYDNNHPPPQSQSDRFRRVGGGNGGSGNNQSYSRRVGNGPGTQSYHSSVGNSSTYSAGYSSVGNQSTQSAQTVPLSGSKPDRRMPGAHTSANHVQGNGNGNGTYSDHRSSGNNGGNGQQQNVQNQQNPQSQQQPQQSPQRPLQQQANGDMVDLQQLIGDGNPKLKDSASATMPSRGPEEAPSQRPQLKRSHSARPVASGTTHSSLRQQQNQSNQGQQAQPQGNAGNQGQNVLPNTNSNPLPSRHAQLAKDAAELQAAGYNHVVNFIPDDLPNLDDLNIDIRDDAMMSGYDAYFGVDGNTAGYNKLQLTQTHSAQSSSRWNNMTASSAGGGAGGSGHSGSGYNNYGYSAQQLSAHLPQLDARSYSAQTPASYQQQQQTNNQQPQQQQAQSGQYQAVNGSNAQNQRNLKSAQKTFQAQQWQLDKLEKFKQQKEKAAAAAAAAKMKEAKGDGAKGAGAQPTTALSVLTSPTTSSK